MRKFRWLLAAAVTVLALGAVGSTSVAFAAEDETCENNATSGPYELCVETKETTSQTLSGVGGVSTLKSKVGAATVEISCKTSKFTTLGEAEGKSSAGKITFETCTMVKPAATKCTVTSPIVAEFTDQLSPVTGALFDTFTGSKAGKEFVTITISQVAGQECAAKGTFAITGEQEATFDAGIATEATTHTIKAVPAGSKLKLGVEKAEFTSEATIEALTGGGAKQKFSIQKS